MVRHSPGLALTRGRPRWGCSTALTGVLTVLCPTQGLTAQGARTGCPQVRGLCSTCNFAIVLVTGMVSDGIHVICARDP